MHRHPVPVTVLGGADATGLAVAVAGDQDCVVATGWQGPGSVLIEPDVAHRAPGCPCCAMRLDLVDGLLRAVRRADPPRRVLLVAGPRDDIATIVYTLLSDADLVRHIQLDGVVVAIDAVAGATRMAAEHPLGTALELDAIAVADVLVLAQADRLTTDGLARLHAGLHEINAIGGRLDLTTDEGNDRRLLRDRLLGLRAWTGAPALTPSAPHLPGPAQTCCAQAAQTLVLRSDVPLDADAVDEWFDTLIASHASRLLRLQGALSVHNEPERTCCVGVRSFAVSWSERYEAVRGGPSDPAHESVVIVVGHDLDVDTLSREFAATQTR